MTKRYTEEFKEMAIAHYKQGSSVKEVCEELGIARSTLLLWCKESRPDENGRTPREQYLLQKELEHLRAENQIFRESGCCLTSPLEDRIESIHRLKDTPIKGYT